jgi:hypothetical protein
LQGEKMSRSNFTFSELKKSISLTVKTKSPDKWLLVDRETGQVYKGNQNGYWDRLDPVIKTINENDA